MDTNRIATRYAKGFFAYAKQINILDVAYCNCNTIIRFFKVNRDIEEFLKSPIISSEEKISKLNQFAEGDLSPYTLKFIKLMIDNQRGVHVYNAFLLFKQLYLKEKGIVDVTVETPVSISLSEKEALKRALTKKLKSDLELNVEVREDLIGGFLVMVNGKVLDMSVKGQLNKIRKKLVNG